MTKVDLTVRNMGYYAFNPRAKELSPLDRKIALIVTVLLSLTAGLGHLICGIVYGINKTSIDSTRPAASTEETDASRLINEKAQIIFQDLESKINECYDVVIKNCAAFEHMGIRILGTLGVDQKINKLCRIAITDEMHLPSLLNDCKQDLLQEIKQKLVVNANPSKIYDLSIEILHTTAVAQGGELFNRYYIVTGSVSQSDVRHADNGPGYEATVWLPERLRALAPEHPRGRDEDLFEID